MEDKFLIMCLNCSTASGYQYAFFLLEDENDNTRVFDTEQEAMEEIIQMGSDGPFAYAILCTGDFVYK
jgi:hypothetical protein